MLEQSIYGAIWIVIFLLPLIGGYFAMSGGLEREETRMVIRESWLSILPFFVLFLLNNYGLVPYFLFKKRYWQYTVSLIFVIFVENAFKHGVSYRSESFIHVLMQLDEGNRLSFRCSNSNNGSADEQHHGIGLENIRKRLRLLFGNDYTLSITEEEHKFDVLLIIPLFE